METILNILHSIFSVFDQLQNSNLIALLKVLSVLISLILIWIIIRIVIKAEIIKSKIKKAEAFWLGSKYEKKKVLKIWRRIIKLLQEDHELARKQSVLLADHLLEEMLDHGGWPGKDLGDRLSKITTNQMPDIDRISTAHRVTLRIFNEPNLVLSHNDAVQVLMIYEKVFKDFGLLD